MSPWTNGVLSVAWPVAFKQREGWFFLECRGVCNRNPLLNQNHRRPLSQDSGSIIGIDTICIFPSVMLLRKSIPSYLELEAISEPLSIDILLHNPEVLVVDLHRRWRWLLMSWNCVRLCLQQDIDMENIVDSPTCRQLKVVSQIQELVLDLKGTMPIACELWRGFIG